MQNDNLACPVCKSSKLSMKYEAKYVYTYVIDNDTPGLKNDTEFLPFLYDKREQTEANQYVECSSCGARFPCYYSTADKGFNFKPIDMSVIRNSLNQTDLQGTFN